MSVATTPPDTSIQAAQLSRTGMTLGQVATQLEVSTEQARGMIQDGRRILDQRTPVIAPARPTLEEAQRPATDRELLRWAAANGSPSRARQIAGRIQVLLGELREIKEKQDATAVVRERLAQAQAAVAAARAELKRMQGGQTAAVPAGVPATVDRRAGRVERQVIRDWARVNGWPEIGVTGIIAKPVMDAYEAFRRAAA